VREGCALREPGRARCVLDVDRLVRGERGLDLLELRLAHGLTPCEQTDPVVLEDERLPELGALAPHLGEHRDVVRLAEATGEHEGADARPLQRVLELTCLVGRVDVDEDRADARGGVLRDHPLVAVRRPDPDAVALRDAACQEAASGAVDVVPEPRPRRAVAVPAVDERLSLGETTNGLTQALADGLVEKRRVGRAAGVRVCRIDERRGSHLTRSSPVPEPGASGPARRRYP
jgi:hypothetical protein